MEDKRFNWIELKWRIKVELNWVVMPLPYAVVRGWMVGKNTYGRYVLKLYILKMNGAVKVMMTYRQGGWKRSIFITRGSEAPGGQDRRENLCSCLFDLNCWEQTSRRESGHMLPGKKTHCSFAIDWVTFRFRSLQGLGLNVQSGQRKHKATWGDGVTFRHSVASSAA